jgi:hypothetical protein
VIQHKDLRHVLAQGLNHIPLQPTHIAKAISAVMQAYEQLVQILDLEHSLFPVFAAKQHLHTTCPNMLKAASRSNKHYLRYQQSKTKSNGFYSTFIVLDWTRLLTMHVLYALNTYV